ncbi:MAG: YihY/virulence factor BrkB family protein, partial [Chloroflexota bacterium]
MRYFRNLWHIIVDAFKGSEQHNVFKLSASLSFYSLFALGPIFLVIMFVSNLFWGRQVIEGEINSQISVLIGDTAAGQVQEFIRNAWISSNNLIAMIGIVALLISATTIFTDIQESMNTIWNLRVKTGRGWQQVVRNRLLSFAIVMGLGFLLLAFLVIDSLLDGFMSRLKVVFPKNSIAMLYIANLLMTVIIVALFFAFIYKVMPDAMIHWKEVWPGSLFSAVFFMAGKFGVNFYINLISTGNSYSSAGAMVILMLWIYYSATIFYFGAEFTKAYALKYGAVIRVKDWAVTTEATVEDTNE